MWFNSIQRYSNYTILFNGVATDNQRGGALIWHENGKTLFFDSYSYSGPSPVLINNVCYHLRTDIFIDYELKKKYKIATISQHGYLKDDRCIGHPEDEITLGELESTDREFIDIKNNIHYIFERNCYEY